MAMNSQGDIFHPEPRPAQMVVLLSLVLLLSEGEFLPVHTFLRILEISLGSGRGPPGYNPYLIWAYAFCLLLAPLKLKSSGCCNQLTCMAGVTKVPVLALPSGFSSFFFFNLGDFLKFSQVQ